MSTNLHVDQSTCRYIEKNSENEKFCCEGVMKMSIKSKVYVVRKGRKTGVFNSWEACELQVAGITGAQFRTFDSTQEEEIEKYLNEHLLSSIKCYAVKREGFLGVFETWEECQTELTTFPESTHKGFPTLKEAYQFLGVKNKTELKQMEQKRKREQEQLQEQNSIPTIQKEEPPTIFVGGSYAESVGMYSSAFIIVKRDIKMAFKKRLGTNKVAAGQLGAVAGELAAVMLAVDYAIKKDIKHITLFYTNQSIYDLLVGREVATNRFKEQYVLFMENKVRDSNIRIDFIKTEPENEIKWNDAVDLLAQSALFDFGFDSKF